MPNITITDEHCLLHHDIDLATNRGTVALTGLAHDDEGNAWELETYVDVKWRRVTYGVGRCHCGAPMQARRLGHPKARARCAKCGSEMFVSNMGKATVSQ